VADRARYRVVFLDLGGTLIDAADYPRWVELGRSVGLELDEYHLAHAYHEVHRETDGPVPPSKPEFWESVLTRASGAPVARAAAESFYEALRADRSPPRLYSDARRCLVHLREQGRRLAIISNSTSEASVRAILKATLIEPFFEAVISSGTEGVAKPDVRIFRRAVERMAVAPAEAFHVGDLAYRDARAAQLAGLASVWLNREGWGFGEDPPEITSLAELPYYLEALEGSSEGARVK